MKKIRRVFSKKKKRVIVDKITDAEGEYRKCLSSKKFLKIVQFLYLT